MDCCGSKNCSPSDLTTRKIAWLLWCLPIVLLIIGASWASERVWLWVPALTVMGIGCMINAASCGRTHCYVTGPMFLLAACYVILSELQLVPMNPGLFLVVLLAASLIAQWAEVPFGKYRNNKRDYRSNTGTSSAEP